MTVGRLFGVRIVINPFFLVLLVVLGLLDLLIETVVIFGVVLLHEVAHVVVARSSGLQVAEVELLPFGGVAKIDDLVEIDPTIEISVALAGPLTNVFLIGLALIEAQVGVVPAAWRSFFIQANAAIAAVNLLPALPLDGGRVYRAKMARRIGFRRATDRAARLGKVIAALLGAAGGVAFYLGHANVSPVVLAFFLYIAAGKEKGLAAYVLIRYLTRKQAELRRKGCLVSHNLVSRPETPVKEVVRHFVPQRYHIVWVIGEGGQLVGYATEADVIDAMFSRGVDTTVGDVLQRVG